ncbi:MAG TPA: dihydrolipoamide acetyltransferase family protein [Nocardioides sp.]|nr:dihydrolipoamide acetyltransferase family protein [Nocardioides sp.]
MARIPILMPKMSMTMTEGEVSSWLVKVGDRVEAGDVVCEVLTDKVDMEVESTSAGTLVEIVAESGTVAVGEPIGYLEGEDDGLGLGDLLAPEPEPEPAAAAPTSDAETLASDHPDDSAEWKAVPARSGPVAAVPRARGLARERGIDLATVTGTGPDGLVTVADVDKVRRPAPAATSATTATAAKPQKDRGAMIRAAVARKMTESAGVPQFTVWRDLALDAVDVARRRQGVSWTTSLLQAYAGALRDVPDLLSRWDSAALDGRGAAVPSGPPAVALAVATEGGLLVPVFVEPDARDPRELDAEVKQVVAAAHSGRLDPAYLGVANGSLSNLGGMGVDRFQALVTPPQASVLALGAIKQRPVAVPGGVGSALTITAGLTVDHRVADGAHAAGLLDAFARRLTATEQG